MRKTLNTLVSSSAIKINLLSEKTVLVKKIYDSQIGVREKGENNGPEVEKFLAYVGLSKGQPWCAAFVCWVLGQASVPNPRSGWSPDLFRQGHIIWTAENAREDRVGHTLTHSKRLSTNCSSDIATGDVFGLYFPEKQRIAHVGFIDSWGETWLTSVEGNTNVTGSREGDGVYRKRRLQRTIYRVARFINLTN